MFNPTLDLDAARAEFERRGRVRIDDVLMPEIAAGLRRCLLEDVPWGPAYFGPEGKGVTLRPGQMAAMTEAERQALKDWIHSSAREGYQFLYDSYMIVTAYKEGRDPDLPLHKVLEYLNSNVGLEFFSRVTGLANLVKVDAQATRYLPGHFLKTHNDTGSTHAREVAYVLGLTRGWEPHWGGLLHFLDEAGRPEEVFMPGYNCMSLFRVPKMHFVSQVAGYAGAPRLSITGWARSR